MTNIDMRHLMTIAEAPPVSQRREPTISPQGSTPAPAATSSAPADAATALTQALQALQAQNLTPDQIKAVLTQWKQELSKTVAAPQGRPYRYKNQSWQVVDGKWINAQTNQPAPMYYVAQLNAWKKKVDAQRATGNLTDSKTPRTPTL